ncbi:MAG: right-handed parallel beta-helix repeat-containing protein [Vicinamibacterales bacterium]
MNVTFRCAGAALAVLLSAGTASAQATRTWVSGVGDDANPCSRTAPCKTFAGAISKTAAGGIISVLDPGGFGAVTITKSITLDGGGVDGSITAPLTTGITVNVGAADQVTLRNLAIYGVGSGVYGIRVLGASGYVSVDHCIVSGFSNGIDFNSTGKLSVSDSSFIDQTGFGVIVRQGRASVDRSRFDNNVQDALRVSGGGTASVRRSTAAGHGNVAFSAVGAGSRLTLDDTQVTNNAYGVGAMSGGSITMANTTVFGNTVQGLYFDGASSLLSFGDNRVVGNSTNGTFSGTESLQ